MFPTTCISRLVLWIRGWDVDAFTYQISNFFRQHKALRKDNRNRIGPYITRSQVSPTLAQGQWSYTVTADIGKQPTVIQFRLSTLNLEVAFLSFRINVFLLAPCSFAAVRI